MLVLKQELQNIPIKNVSINEYSLYVFTLTLPMATMGRKGRTKVFLLGEQLNVESAVRKIFESVGYSVLKGEDVHLASHVVTGKFMGINDNDVFKNWAHHYGYKDRN